MHYPHHRFPSAALIAPQARQPLLAVLQRKQTPPAHLADFPQLAIAASTTTAELDPGYMTFHVIGSALETLNRLGLSVSSAWLLMLLARSGPQFGCDLCRRMKISSAAITGLITRLESLSLIGIKRGNPPDRRVAIITLTEAGRKVLASVVALTDLGAAAAAALNEKTTKAAR